ncbi:MAG: hypothetical protein R2748_16605 [Bryobacterales bacterium]
MGANVSMVIKSGTNELHGTVYSTCATASPRRERVFANRNGLPKTPFRLNQYGVAVGGPIPKMSNKMFWFVSWEGFRRRRGSTQIGSVPTQDYRNGDFSARGGTILNPFTGTPFANNVIPQSRINPAIPTALDLTAPLPNRPGLTQNFVGNRSQANDRDGLHWRWDYNLNESNTFFFRFSYQNADLNSPDFRPSFQSSGQFDVVNYGGAGRTSSARPRPSKSASAPTSPTTRNLSDKGGLTRADFLSKTGLQMYQTEVFGDPLVNISFGEYGTPALAAT